MLRNDIRLNYVMNSTIPGLEEADLILVVGANPRMEAPLINAKLRKTVLNYGCEIFSVGNPWESTFRIENLGLGADDFIKIASGR